MTNDQRRLALEALAHPVAFLNGLVKIYDSATGSWVPFSLWPKQVEIVNLLDRKRLLVLLKARQLGITWLCLGYALWLLCCRPGSRILVFSRRDEDAEYLLYKERLRGMHERLPEWFVQLTNAAATNDAMGVLTLANDSTARAFPVNGGDSYTGTFAMADEFDLPNPDEQRHLLGSVKPTIETGKMVLLSRANKDYEDTPFKRTYRLAVKNRQEGIQDGWWPAFLAWDARPGRDAAWYERTRRETEEQGQGDTDDFMLEHYPSTDEEALSPRSTDARFATRHLSKCFQEAPTLRPLLPPHKPCPALTGLLIYQHPAAGGVYVLGADPAEGNPRDDPSAAVVLDALSWEEVCCLQGPFEPAVFAAHIDSLGCYYNSAALLVERNNHGHAVLLWLREHSKLFRLWGHDGKAGWTQTGKGKALLTDHAAQVFRDGDTCLHTRKLAEQLSSIKASTLSGPEHGHDDLAIACLLALWAATKRAKALEAKGKAGLPHVHEFGAAPPAANGSRRLTLPPPRWVR